jgi:signal transduction histidine kinase
LFFNLLTNALKYSIPGKIPELSITAEKVSGTFVESKEETWFWKIDFVDNGIGFDEKHKDKIFQIFQRLHTQSEYSGTGIGLAICKKIVENHKGYISVQSKTGEGSTFSIFLPEHINEN